MTYTGHIPVDQVLDSAKERRLLEVLVIGWDENGLYAASSSGRTEDILELIDALKRGLAKVPA